MSSSTANPSALRVSPLYAWLLAGGVALAGASWFAWQHYHTTSTAGDADTPQMATVTTTSVREVMWQPTWEAVATLRAVQGVEIAPEVSGIVDHVALHSGEIVKQGEVLVQLLDDSDRAQLRALTAQAQLAESVLKRDRALYEIKVVSAATLDTDVHNLENAQALQQQQAAMVSKKCIRAPFSGRLGISTVTRGQYLNAGASFVSLQATDTVLLDFEIPQQQAPQLAVGRVVHATTDAWPGVTFTGTVNAIDPDVDPKTRNIQVEATIPNSDHRLTPGMYMKASVDLGVPQQQTVISQSALQFNLYGTTVFVIEPGKSVGGKPAVPVARERLVTLGQAKGNDVVVLAGIKPGERIVDNGQLKLKNNTPVRVVSPPAAIPVALSPQS